MAAVHPTRLEFDGVPSVRRIEDLPFQPDVAFVAVNRHATVEAVGSLAQLGCGAAVCYASGFAETEGEDSLQAALVSAAAGMPIIGPNCYGTVSALSGAALWPDEQGCSRTETGVAFVTQSGNIGVNLTMQCRGLAISTILTLGNQDDVGIEECLDMLVDDPSTTAVGLHIEALTDVTLFVAAAERARRRGIPVVALKTGSSATGALIAASHTASLAGSDTAYTALFARSGVRRVHSIPELLDTLHVLESLGPLPGNRLVSLSCSGGEASLTADAAEGLGVTFPEFDEVHALRIADTLSELVTISNPLDYHTFIWGNEAALRQCFAAALDGPVDAGLLLIDLPGRGIDADEWWPTLRGFSSAAEQTRTPGVVVATMSENMPAEVRQYAHENGLAAVSGIDSALRALEAAAWIGTVTEQPPLLKVAPTEGRSVRTLSESASKERLVAAGVPIPTGQLVPSEEAAAVAEALGFPVIMKTTGHAHKTELGGVIAVDSRDSAYRAAEELARLGPQVLVEELVQGEVELLVAVRAEHPLGHALTLGAGGALVEVLRDTQTLLLPTGDDEIRSALGRLSIWPLLAGHRASAPVDLQSIFEVIHNLTALVASDEQLREVEINPLLVGPAGVHAVDALIATMEEE